MTRQDSRSEIRVELDGDQEQDGLMIYPPGSTISGRVEIMPRRDIACDHLLLQLKWQTQGKGDRDEQIIDQRDIYQGVLTGGIRITEDFTFTLPVQPWSYAGHYINIVWAIEVKIDIPLAKDVNYSQPFIMAPAGERVTPTPPPDSIW